MGHGLMSACQPWSGHYREQPTLYAVAHTTQFAKPRTCSYLENSAVGLGGAGGGWVEAKNRSSIVVFLCESGSNAADSTTAAASKQWSAVIETGSAESTDFATPTAFSLKHMPSGTPKALHVWRTCEEASEWLQKQPDVTVSADGSFAVQLKPQCIFTITTMSSGAKAVATHPIPSPAHMSLTYIDDFEKYAIDTPVKYFTDEGGSFAAAAMPASTAFSVGSAGVLAQQVLQKPIHGNCESERPVRLCSAVASQQTD
jgi:hypothetical protein